MDKVNFKQLLGVGQGYENICIKYYETKGYICTERPENHIYDFKLDNNETYEVKYDRMNNKTKNYYIEFLQNKKPSGIQTTKADFHILTNGRTYYKIKTDVIRELIRDEKYKMIRTMAKEYTTGYPDITEGYIFSENVIISNSEKLDIS